MGSTAKKYSINPYLKYTNGKGTLFASLARSSGGAASAHRRDEISI